MKGGDEDRLWAWAGALALGLALAAALAAWPLVVLGWLRSIFG